ncbi:MAG: hypothetical protein ABIJ04_12750 [Bacteroidota bacterium]
MDINGWLTVVAIFIAILAFIPKEELRLLRIISPKIEQYGIIVILIVIIPYLLYFPEFVKRWPFLHYLTVNWGFDSKNIAFALFYITFLWILARILGLKTFIKSNEQLIEYYKELIREIPFERFFKVFSKYSQVEEINKMWNLYSSVIKDPIFLKSIIERNPYYLLNFWGHFKSEKDFQDLLRLYLENPESLYYTEIKEHWNAYSLLEDKPFLKNIIEQNLAQSINAGILPFISEFVVTKLQNENSISSIYNQSRLLIRRADEDGFHLPIYFHIRFIGLLYATAIENKVDISTLSPFKKNMLSVYSSMIGAMLKNIRAVESNENEEYPTNYHWLIRETFSIINNWLTSFNEDEYFDENNEYLIFFPTCIEFCLQELYSSFKHKIISQEFLLIQIYYNVLRVYFSGLTKNQICCQIEDQIIKNIPGNLIKPIFDYSLNEEFAKSFDELINGRFDLLTSSEKEKLLRVKRFLLKEGIQL